MIYVGSYNVGSAEDVVVGAYPVKALLVNKYGDHHTSIVTEVGHGDRV